MRASCEAEAGAGTTRGVHSAGVPPMEFADGAGFDERSMGRVSMPMEDSPPAVIDPSTGSVAKLRAAPPEFATTPFPPPLLAPPSPPPLLASFEMI